MIPSNHSMSLNTLVQCISKLGRIVALASRRDRPDRLIAARAVLPEPRKHPD